MKDIKGMQIGVMGSMADIKLKKYWREQAGVLGQKMAEKEAILLYGFEGDFDSFSTMAARGAEKYGGIVVAFAWGKKADRKTTNIRIETGQMRGGGREFSLILSCDAVICIGGGSGTLMEISMAYQAGVPVIVLDKSGGWSERLANKFLDERRRFKIISAKNVEQALEKVSKLKMGM